MSLLEPQDRADHRRGLGPLARTMLPLFGYAPEAIEAFLAKDPPDGEFFEFRDGERYALMQISRGDEGWNIRYVLPARWKDRFESVAGAMEALKRRFLKEPRRRIFMLIRENPPSHSAYFAGMLPSLGFKLMPRVTFTRDIESLPELPSLADGFEEIAIEGRELNTAADAYHAAHVEHSLDATQEEHERHRLDRREMFHREYEHGDAQQSWVTVAHRGQIVATAFGRVYGRELCVEEVGVVPEHRGRGLGRYICVRVMEKLLECALGGCDVASRFRRSERSACEGNFTSSPLRNREAAPAALLSPQVDEPPRFFLVGTDRRYTSAMQLYPSLGFRLHEFHTYAMFEAPCYSVAAERGSGGR